MPLPAWGSGRPGAAAALLRRQGPRRSPPGLWRGAQHSKRSRHLYPERRLGLRYAQPAPGLGSGPGRQRTGPQRRGPPIHHRVGTGTGLARVLPTGPLPFPRAGRGPLPEPMAPLPLGKRPRAPSRLARWPHRHADHRCRHAPAHGQRLDAQPLPHDRGLLPGERPDLQLAAG